MNKKIEICFISSNPDLNNGAYRIWVRDLASYFNQLNIKTHINKIPKNIKSNLVIILSKSDCTKIDDFKKKYPKNLIGIINQLVVFSTMQILLLLAPFKSRFIKFK